MTIIVRNVPEGYRVKLWGDISNQERWWGSQQQAYLERRILLKYNPKLDAEAFLVYYDVASEGFTVLERVG